MTTLAQAQDAVVNAGPWWGTAIIAGVATLAGGLITVSVQSIIEWRKGKREHHRRWDDRTLEVALEFMDTVNIIAPQRVHVHGVTEAERRATFDGQEMLLQIELHLRRLRVVAPKIIYDRAEDLSFAATAYMLEPIDEKRSTSHVFPDLHNAYTAFYDELKSTLKTRTGKGMKKKDKLVEKRGAVSGPMPKKGVVQEVKSAP
ncbi:hypothetical protein [Rhodococcus sp. NPDC004095]